MGIGKWHPAECVWKEQYRYKQWTGNTIDIEPPSDAAMTIAYLCIYCGGTKTEVEAV